MKIFHDTCHKKIKTTEHNKQLSEKNKRQVFIPNGFAHGFVVLSEGAVFSYKVDQYYSKNHEKGVAFNDNNLNIDWLHYDVQSQESVN